MVNETIGKMEVDKESVLAAIKAVKEKGLDINPFTVADEAKVSAQAVYGQSEYMDLITQERGSPLVVNADEVKDLKAKVKELESRVRQLQIQNEVLTMQQQTQYDLGHKLGIIEGKKLKAQEIAAAEAAKSLAGETDLQLDSELKARKRESTTETGESNVIQISNTGYVPELVGNAAEPVISKQQREDEGWDTPDVLGEADLQAGGDVISEVAGTEDSRERQEITGEQVPSEFIDNLKEVESEANAPQPELEAGIPTAMFLSAVEDKSESFGESYSQKVFNAARSGPFVASEFNPLLELSWKDLETVYHFRAKSLKDFSKQIQQNQPATPPPPPPQQKQKVRVPIETNGDSDERHIDEIAPLPSETLTGDNWDRFPEQGGSSSGQAPSYIQSPDETTQEPEALEVGRNEFEFVEPESSGFDLDAMDIFEGLDDYGNLQDIEIIQDVQLGPDGKPPSDDELRDLIKNRIKQAKEMAASEQRDPHLGAAAKDEQKGLGSKFIGGKTRPKPGETGQGPNEPPPPTAPQSAPQPGAAPPPPPPATSQSAGAAPGPGFVRQVPPEIRKACMLLGVRPEEMTIESVTDAWKRQITAPGVHPDQGGDTESAIFLNTAKDTILRWLYDQAPKLGKKWGPGGPKSGPGSKPGPGGKGPTP